MVYVCAIWGYFYGWSGMLWVALCIVALTFGLLLFLPRISGYLEDAKNSGSLHEYLAGAFAGTKATSHRPKFRLLCASVTLISLFMALAIETHLAALLLSNLLGWDVFPLVILTVGLVSLYSSKAGFAGVVRSDILQAVAFGLGLAAVLALLFRLTEWSAVTAQYPLTARSVLTGAGYPNIIGIIVLGAGWMLVTADSWQRFSATRSERTSRFGMAVGGTLLTVVVIGCALVGMLVKAVVEPSLAPDLAAKLSNGLFPWNDVFLLADSTPFTTACLLLICYGLFMAAVSTTDTFLVVSAHVFLGDVVLARQGNKTLGTLTPDENALHGRTAKYITGILSAAVVACWIVLHYLRLLTDPITLFFITYSLQFSLLVPLLVTGLPVPRREKAAMLSVCLGFLGTAVAGTTSWFFYYRGVTTEFWGLGAGDWLALLPVITLAGGILGYAAGLIVFPSRNTKSTEQ